MARKTIGLEQLDDLEFDEANQLYWRGKAVVLDKPVELAGATLLAAWIGAIGALLAGLHPFLHSFGFIP